MRDFAILMKRRYGS